MRPDVKNPAWRAIQKTAVSDKRIHIIDAMFSKLEVLSLYKACDCFVSLHRAEGFGRGIAEALLLGLDVIATDYGGNVDFCQPAGAHLVPYRLVPVGKKDYVEGEGQYWADPDKRVAARFMQTVAAKTNPKRRTKKVSTSIQALFKLEVIGARYRERLERISSMLQSSTQN
jgi:glycosyltransferase involved in cell wall biosynthesis